jgi:hypothetical protein
MTDVEIFQRIQDEQLVWTSYNFGDRPAWMPLLGIVEELGELVDGRSCGEKIDAIGDMTIFAIDYCSAMGWNAADLWDHSISLSQPMVVVLGTLAHNHLKRAEGIRTGEDQDKTGQTAIADLFAGLSAKANVLGKNLPDIVWQTWLHVKERDWKRFPENGRTA